MPKSSTFRAQIDLILTLSVLWAALFLARPLWFHPWCAVTPTPCTPNSVNAFDQISFQFHSIAADYFSNVVQNLVGIFAFIAPWIWVQSDPKKSMRLSLLVGMAALVNGVMMEIVRALVQRPRPLVFQTPLIEGASIDQYTSFYSGHTSFVALSLLTTVLWMRKEKLKRSFQVVLVAHPLLVILTATLRVWGGRHFPTDTLAGWAFGSIAAFVAYLSFARQKT